MIESNSSNGDARVTVTDDGLVFVAVPNDPPDIPLNEFITVYRSTDGGTTFSQWGQLGSLASGLRRLCDLAPALRRAAIRPPCASMIVRQIASPMPSPRGRVV